MVFSNSMSRGSPCSVPLQLSVAHQDAMPGAEMRGEPLHEKHRPVLAAGTTQRDGEIAARVARVTRQPFFQEAANIVEHPDDFRLPFKKSDDFGVQSGQGPQLRVVMRIGQATSVE